MNLHHVKIVQLISNLRSVNENLEEKQKEIEQINVVEEKPKKVFRRPIKDTTKAKVLGTKARQDKRRERQSQDKASMTEMTKGKNRCTKVRQVET